MLHFLAEAGRSNSQVAEPPESLEELPDIGVERYSPAQP